MERQTQHTAHKSFDWNRYNVSFLLNLPSSLSYFYCLHSSISSHISNIFSSRRCHFYFPLASLAISSQSSIRPKCSNSICFRLKRKSVGFRKPNICFSHALFKSQRQYQAFALAFFFSCSKKANFLLFVFEIKI